MPESTNNAKDLVVFRVRRDARCAECDTDVAHGDLLRVEDKRPLCLACADLDQLVFLPSGDAALTRRARAHSTLHAVVVEWSRSRKRHERQGLLVESAALETAEAECLSDAEGRARRRERAAERREDEDMAYIAAFASSIRQIFPACPPAEALQIATHACQRYSGRVGRTAAAKVFDPEAVQLAVRAHVRHSHTADDRLLAECGDRSLARGQVREQVEELMSAWQRP